jgi:hypothetical protein
MDETDGTDIELELQDQELARRLHGGRPVPAAGFRGALGRRIASLDPGYGPRPARIRLMVAAYAVAGMVLIAAGALVAIGTL